jgi:hypothetical protein
MVSSRLSLYRCRGFRRAAGKRATRLETASAAHHEALAGLDRRDARGLDYTRASPIARLGGLEGPSGAADAFLASK